MPGVTILDIIGAIGGLGGAAAFLSVLMDRRLRRAQARKTEAEVAGTIVDSSGDLVDQYRKLAEESRCEVAELKKTLNQHSGQIGLLNRTVERYAQRITYLMGGISQLIQQIVGLNATPIWTPDRWTGDEELHDGPFPPRTPPGD